MSGVRVPTSVGFSRECPTNVGYSDYAVRFNIAFEVLQSSYLAVVAAVLPFHSDLFRICARSDRASWGIQGNRHGNLALAAMSAVLRGWLRSGEVGI